jgi:hypothetical protein
MAKLETKPLLLMRGYGPPGMVPAAGSAELFKDIGKLVIRIDLHGIHRSGTDHEGFAGPGVGRTGGWRVNRRGCTCDGIDPSDP